MFRGIKLLPASFRLPEKLVIFSGYIHLIRFIRSDCVLNIFGEKYILPGYEPNEDNIITNVFDP